MSEQDFAPGLRFAITWLHERAKQMRDPDPKARQILDSAAFSLGVAKARGGFVLNDRIASLESALASASRECEQSRKTIAELRETIKSHRNVMLNAYWALHESKHKRAFDLLDAALQGGNDEAE